MKKVLATFIARQPKKKLCEEAINNNGLDIYYHNNHHHAGALFTEQTVPEQYLKLLDNIPVTNFASFLVSDNLTLDKRWPKGVKILTKRCGNFVFIPSDRSNFDVSKSIQKISFNRFTKFSCYQLVDILTRPMPLVRDGKEIGMLYAVNNNDKNALPKGTFIRLLDSFDIEEEKEYKLKGGVAVVITEDAKGRIRDINKRSIDKRTTPPDPPALKVAKKLEDDVLLECKRKLAEHYKCNMSQIKITITL